MVLLLWKVPNSENPSKGAGATDVDKSCDLWHPHPGGGTRPILLFRFSRPPPERGYRRVHLKKLKWNKKHCKLHKINVMIDLIV